MHKSEHISIFPNDETGTETVQLMTNATREKLYRLITTLFYWYMVTLKVDQEVNSLLKMIVNLWITVQSYSFANS